MITYLISLTFDSPQVFIWSLCLGFNVAMIISFLYKKLIGGLITSILDKNAISEDTALNLDQLGYGSNSFIKLFLRDKSSLRSLVSLVGDKLITTKNEKGKDIPDFSSARFYIAEEQRDKASSLKQGNIKWYLIPIFAIVSVIMAYIIVMLLPYITF